MGHRYSWLRVALCVCALASVAVGAIETETWTSQTFLLSGSGGHFSFMPPVINGAGDVAFEGSSAIWGPNGSGGVTKVAAVGQQPVGLPAGTTYTSMGDAHITDAGVAFFAQTQGGGGVNGVWGPDLAGNLTLVERQGAQVPGQPAGVLYGAQFPNNFRANRSGQIVVGHNFQLGSGGIDSSNSEAILASSPTGPLVVAAKNGQQAAGMAAGVTYTSAMLAGVSNDQFKFGFISFLQGPGIDGSNNNAVFAPGPGGVITMLAQKGSLGVPGVANARWNNYSIPGVTPDGRTMIGGTMAIGPGGVTTDNNSGLWITDAAGVLTLKYREGQQVPGLAPGILWESMGFTQINSTGTTILAIIKGTGVTTLNDSVLLISGLGPNFSILAREGDHAPGTPADVVFSSLNFSHSNDSGDVVLGVALAGAGVTSDNDLALFGYDPALGLKLIAREGDLLQVSPGVFKTISNLDASWYSTSNTHNRVDSILSDSGKVIFRASFPGFSSGLFTTTLAPEPACGGIFAMLLLAATRRRP